MTTPSQVLYRLIPLTQGQYALVDEEDYERIAKHKWCARWSKGTQTFYAISRLTFPDRSQRTIYMHREVLGLKYREKLDGEHRDPSQTLDNRKSNLRIATRSQNGANARKNRRNSSGFKGVTFNNHSRSRKQWVARIMIQQKSVWLGRHATPEEAHAAYSIAAKNLKGEFARVV